MYKKLAILILFSLLHIGCNYVYNDTMLATQNTLPIKSIQTYSDGQTYGGTFEYKGNKLIKSTDINNNYFTLYYYTSDLITLIKQFDKNKKLIESLNFEYDTDNRLVKEIHSDGTEINYSFNNDGSIVVAGSNENKVLFTKDNKIINEQLETGETYLYEYDSNNNPLKNIVGMDKLYYSNEFGNMGTLFNILKKELLTDKNSYITQSNFKYNDKKFPILESYIQKDNENKIIDKFTIAYTYNK